MKFSIRCNGKQFNSLCDHVAGAIFEAKDIMKKEGVTASEIYDEGVEYRPRVTIENFSTNGVPSLRGTMKGLFGAK